MIIVYAAFRVELGNGFSCFVVWGSPIFSIEEKPVLLARVENERCDVSGNLQMHTVCLIIIAFYYLEAKNLRV